MAQHAAAPMFVRDVMTPNPATVSPQTPVRDAVRMLRELACRHLPVLDGGRLVGIVSSTDLRPRSPRPDDQSRPVVELMTPQPRLIAPEEAIEVAAQEMAVNKVNSLLVVERGRLVGILTTYDLLEALVRRLRAPT